MAQNLRGPRPGLHERFTDAVRMSLGLANHEAKRLNHAYIGTEHMLLGLLAEGSGIAVAVLGRAGLDFGVVRREVERLVPPGPAVVSAERLPTTPRARGVVQRAIDAARELGHDYVGTEHLLLGLLRDGDSVAAQVLVNLGLTLEGVRREVIRLLSAKSVTRDSDPAGPLHRARDAPPPHGAEPLGLRLARLEAEGRRRERGPGPWKMVVGGLVAVVVIVLALLIYGTTHP